MAHLVSIRTSDLSVKRRGMLFVAKLMNGLIRYHRIEHINAFGPIRIFEIPLDRIVFDLSSQQVLSVRG